MSLQPRVPVHERLGRRDSMSSDAADSIIVNVTNRRPNNNMMKRLNYNRNYNVGSINGRSNIQHRLNKNFVNPAIVARNNFSINAINSFMESAMKTFGGAQQDTGAVQNGNIMAALASRIMSSMADPKKTDTIDEHKYDMQIQKEISSIQVLNHIRRLLAVEEKIHDFGFFYFLQNRRNRCILSVQGQLWSAAMDRALMNVSLNMRPICRWINDSASDQQMAAIAVRVLRFFSTFVVVTIKKDTQETIMKW